MITKTKNTKHANSPTQIIIPPPNLRKLVFTITGTTPLIMHKWSEKALKAMRLTAAERKKQPKVGRDPEGEAANCAYRVERGPDEGAYGIPAMAVKSAMIDSAHKDRGLARTEVRKALRFKHHDIIPITCSEPITREDVVRVGMNQTDLRYRPEFREWSCQIELRFDADILNSADVINLVNRAGHECGIGEWRSQKGGEYGAFEVDTESPIEEGGE